MFTLTDYAMKRTGKLHGRIFVGSKCQGRVFAYAFCGTAEHEPKMWDNLKGQFMNHIDQVNADLKAAGLPELRYQGKK